MFDGTQELAENKLILLYIFESIGRPISNSHITEIVLENNLMNYFHLQQYLGELVSSGFLFMDKQEKKQLYSISKRGKDVLEFFENRITENKKKHIKAYLDLHRESIAKEATITAEYTPDQWGAYIVTCKIVEKNASIIELKITANSNEEAKGMCARWKSHASDICSNIIKMLRD